MGGSGIGGDLFRAVFNDQLTVPCIVNKDYIIPKWVGPGTLAVISSYSGNTEESLAMYDNAKLQGAKIIVVASGGLLAQKAQADGFLRIIVPTGFAPRTAAGYLFAVLAGAVEQFGLVSGCKAAIGR